MGSRNIVIPIDLTKTGGIIFPTENKVVYTTDTVTLTFNLTGITSYTGVNASVSLVMKDGSAFQHEKPITATPAVFTLQPNEVQHAGMVVGQIEITDSTGVVTSQEFVFSIKAQILDAYETLAIVREIEVDSFQTLKGQVEGIQTAVVANWDAIQANLDTMEAGYASDWSAWFTTNTNSITEQWATFKANAESNEQGRVSAASARHIQYTADHSTATSDHSTALADTAQAEADHTKAVADSTQAGTDHTRAGSDHSQAVADNSRASSDHTRAETNHTTAAADNTRANTDHTRANTDHITALADHASYEGLLTDGVLATNIENKLLYLESTYAPELLSLGSQLADIADSPSGALINNNATAITALNFNLKKIDSRKFLTLPTFETNFDNPNDDISLFAKNDEAVATAITTGKMTFTSGVADAETFFTSPFTFEAGSYYVKIEVKEDSPNTWYNFPRVGIAKDTDNWILGNVDKNNHKASFIVKQNGVFNEYAATTIVRDNFPAPYNLIFSTNGFTAYLIHEKDGVYTTLTNWAQTNVFNFSGVTNLATYKAAVGARTTVGNGYLDVSGFECGYTNGMSMGADFKPFTYEDGSLMQEGNCIYFTGSVHSTEELNGTGGVSIYKLNLSTYQIEFVGRLFQKLGANAFGGASYKVFYDRNRKQWVVTASNFDFIDRQLTIGFTSSDLRSGVHVINTQAIASIVGYVWDNDIIYKDGAYLMTYNQSDGTLHLVQSADLLTWTKVLTKTVTGEGNVFTRVNGNYYILRAETTAGLTVFDLNLNEVGALVTNKWSTLAGFDSPCWGFLCPFSVDDKTNYFLVSFSASLWESRHYTYGNVWVFKALETATGVEFVNPSLQILNA